ncbi:MAG: chemotaxis protein CheA [Brevundimonas sp.]|uniref:chemotaxis protein CheA n=1 Tax=Brevundimonas sp. TaxID=1871086 RepID=UPI004034B978
MDTMDAIRTTFFQECDDLLAELESGLLALQDGEGSSETVNAVFRAVHSVKGGAGAFGLESLVRFAHVFETVLDEVRNGRLEPDGDLIGELLRAADLLADLVAEAKGVSVADPSRLEAVRQNLQAAIGEMPDEPSVEACVDGVEMPGFSPLTVTIDAPTPPNEIRVEFSPTARLYQSANDALVLVRELERLGRVIVEIEGDEAGLESFDLAAPGLIWRVTLLDGADRTAIADVFEFVADDCALAIEEPGSSPPVFEPGPEDALLADLLKLAREADDGLDEEDVSAVPQHAVAPRVEAEPAGSSSGEDSPAARAPGSEALVQTTIRVDLERVDRLIDLVGELVINQAMLAQRVFEDGLARSSQVALGLEDLEQLTREIQDSVMAIRAQPVKSVFQRMPRLVREVAAATGKQVRLVTDGESTEVDKTVIERLADPITHMIRNAIDHGLERPEDRLAAGKAAEGVVRLSAQHRSGRIVIEVSDDGRGIDRPRVRSLAVARGILAEDAGLADEDIDNLIFAPGFSTAPAVSDISGRGVGMDVVKRSIQALGGRIGIMSRPGEGSTFTLSLPLTLAVLDGMVVGVGGHTLVVPINVIVETLRPHPSDLRALGPEAVVLAVRGRHVPMIDLAQAFGWSEAAEAADEGVTLLVETEGGGLTGLRVDAIQGQRQVVIKSLEQNYRQVPGIGAATILGDGRVALILDVDGLLNARRQPSPSSPLLALAS